jgi:sugar lactone lactonase YvrE/predicted small integral membrane protein
MISTHPFIQHGARSEMKTLKSSRLRRQSTGCRWAAIAAWCVTVGLGAEAFAATLHPGDIVVAGQQAVFRVDPVTGDYAVISDNTHGSGPSMYAAVTVTLASDGQLWVTDLGESRIDAQQHPSQILKIDPVTGNRVAIPIQGLAGNTGLMTREVGGQLIVGGIGALFRLNPSTGAASEISGPHAGSGPAFNFLQAFTVSANSAFATNFQRTIRVDLTTGARTIISGSGVGTGPTISPVDVALDSAGFLIETVTTTSQSSPGVFRVDPVTGNRVAISSPTVGGGEPLGVLGGLGIGADGSIYTATRANGIVGVLKIDPTTGNRQWLANLTAAGTSLGGVTIVPANVPEPSTIALAVVGAVLLLLRRQGFARVARRQTLFSLVVLCFSVGDPNAAPAATLHPGDIIVTGRYGKLDGAIYRVDPVTGEPTLIADNSHGAGPVMRNIVGISIASDGQLWVADQGTRGSFNDVPSYAAQILKVDPATGNRVAVPGQTPNLSSLARERDDRLIVSAIEALYSIDPVSGANTLISGLGVGSGPSLFPGQFDLSGNYAFTISFPNITKVDLTTGARTSIPRPNVGPVRFFMANDIAIDSAGFLIETAVWVTGSTAHTAVFRTDPSTGDIVTITSPSVGGGDPLPGGLDEEHLQILGGLGGVAVGDDGSIFASAIGVGLSGVFKIDPVTGDRQLLSNFYDVMPLVYGVAIVPNVPEPSTMLLSVLGGLLVLFYRRRHARPACKTI